MIKCKSCTDWFHGQCVGILESECEKVLGSWPYRDTEISKCKTDQVALIAALRDRRDAPAIAGPAKKRTAAKQGNMKTWFESFTSMLPFCRLFTKRGYDGGPEASQIKQACTDSESRTSKIGSFNCGSSTCCHGRAPKYPCAQAPTQNFRDIII